MLFQTIGQTQIFLWMVAAGVLLGGLYAFFRLLRRLLQAGFWLSLACDMSFGTLGAALLICACVWANHAQLRAYMFFGVFTGMALFFLGPYPLLQRFARGLTASGKKLRGKLCDCRLIKVIFR